MKKPLTKTQRKLLGLMRAGRRLVWFGDAGPELEGERSWPQKRTVRALLNAGHLRWRPYRNQTQRDCGIRGLCEEDCRELEESKLTALLEVMKHGESERRHEDRWGGAL